MKSNFFTVNCTTLIDSMTRRYRNLGFCDKFTDSENKTIFKLYQYLVLEGKRDKTEIILNSDLSHSDIILGLAILLIPDFLDDLFLAHPEMKGQRAKYKEHVRLLKEYFELGE